jgi:LacI family transcriptional regulator
MSAKRVTSQDVAIAAGVSRTTVSMVLNNVPGIQISEETRQRVFDVARELGYVPEAAAQALVSRRSQSIGFVMARQVHHVITDAFLNSLIAGSIQTVHDHNLRLIVEMIDPEHQQEAYLRLARARRIDGMILAGPRFDDQGLKVIEEEGFPVVIIGHIDQSNLCSVDVDNCAAAREAVAHLIQLGHKRIACVTNASPIYMAPAMRLRGYRQALETAGLAFDQNLVRFGDYDLESGYIQMKSLLDDGLSFTAVFVSSDVVALGAKAAIYQRGLRIPQDIALVGFDDVPMARYMEPPLTTIRVPAVQMGSAACRLLIDLITKGDVAKRKITLETELIVRESCGAKRVRTTNQSIPNQ